ncbi:MAG: hypothetical protein JWN62_2259 [Acidimicrobiales bacterium]|nr:hypothetical protein [Acidimicrobiales bacterium]
MNRDRLHSVLRIRELQERSARGELARSRSVHRTADEAERSTWRMLDERIERDRAARSAADLVAVRSVVDAGMLAAETQRACTRHAEAEVGGALQSWSVAARRVEGLVRLSERAAQAARDEAVRKAANEIDDLVLIRFGRGAS